MNGVKQWAFTVCVVAVMCAVLEMLIPDKKYEKLLKPAIAAFAVYALMFPVKRAFSDCKGFVPGAGKTEISSQLREKVSAQAEEAVCSAIDSAVREAIADMTETEARVSAELETGGDGSVKLIRLTVTVSGSNRAEESLIKSRAARVCGLDESKITVNYE